MREFAIRAAIARSIRMIVAACLLGGGLPACGQTPGVGCTTPVIARGDANVVSFGMGSPEVRRLSGDFFGFNLEWIDFQMDLWDSARAETKPAVIEWLAPFRGAVYRYPGGTVANFFDWESSTGLVGGRTAQKAVKWLGPTRALFGFSEFLHFVGDVAGQPWIVLNLYGAYEQELPPAEMSAKAGAWVRRAQELARAGEPAVLRWELGNELDRQDAWWPAAKYAEIASAVAAESRRQSPDAQFVTMLQDWPAQRGHSVAEYNSTVVSRLAWANPEFAQHLYYDGTPGEPVERRFRLVCQSHGVAEQLGIRSPRFWITEHARAAPGQRGTDDWRNTWPRTANLDAAISVADAYILAAQMPAVRGLFLHSLGTANGPWPLFHAGASGQLHPSAVYWAMRLLRDSLLDRVLATTAASRNDSGYAGGYDVRAALLTDETHRKYSLWAVNRADAPATLHLTIPRGAWQTTRFRRTSISDPVKQANNYVVSDRVKPRTADGTFSFDAGGHTTVELPANSVSAVQFGLL